MSLLKLLLIAFAASLLSTAASAEVINGCIKSNGTLKVVADLSQCSSREMPISWNVQGTQGEPGMDGADGQPGEPGSDTGGLARVWVRRGQEEFA